ncbi:MAG: GntR family transcriptional regulator [Christensenellaceae bacterium]|jgi:GntR family transcriptional regulator|nr:GntR family transcriptional regulator [Christensenellaceae bacterium]
MGLFDSKIDKKTPIPLYFQLKEIILLKIKEGEYPKDSMIPTEHEISEFFGLSRTTVRQAISELVQDGWLYRIKSKGTFVSHPKLNQDFIQHLEPYSEQIKKLGMVPSTQVLELKTINATAGIAENLQIKANEKVVLLHRRRFADDEPMVTVKTYLPFDKCAFVFDHNFEKESLYLVLSNTDATKIRYTNRRLEVTEAKARDLELLHLKSGKPIQLTYSVGYNSYHVPIEYSIARYRGDRSSFRITVFPPDR